LERLRRTVVAAVEAGEPQMQAALRFGVSRRAVGEWVRAYRARGEESFRPAQRGRRRGERFALSEAQQERILGVIVAGPPDRNDLPWQLWTRRAVAELVRRDAGVAIRAATVGRYLQRWGIDAVPEAASGACGPRPDEVRVVWTRPRLPPDPRPVHALLALTRRGVLHFLTADRPFDVEALHDFRRRLRMQLARDVRVVVCSWPPEHLESLDSWSSCDVDAALRGALT
jgi:transposase